MTGETITIILLVIGIGALALMILNLLKQTEELDDMVTTTKLEVRNKVNDALKKMKETDLKGAFESDDEVGAVFKDMKQIIEDLEKDI
jgi:predicted PurR-regulated permease PerM